MKGIGEGGIEITGIDDIFSENVEKKLSEASVDFDKNEKTKSPDKKSNDDGSVTTSEGSSK